MPHQRALRSRSVITDSFSSTFGGRFPEVHERLTHRILPARRGEVADCALAHNAAGCSMVCAVRSDLRSRHVVLRQPDAHLRPARRVQPVAPRLPVILAFSPNKGGWRGMRALGWLSALLPRKSLAAILRPAGRPAGLGAVNTAACRTPNRVASPARLLRPIRSRTGSAHRL